MNNRIEYLKRQSMDSVGEGLGGSYWEVDVDKFAALLIQECVDICLNKNVSFLDVDITLNSTTKAIQDLATKSCGENLAKLIQKHFGIQTFSEGDKVLVTSSKDSATVIEQVGNKVTLRYNECIGFRNCWELEKIDD
jgi:hypothetical protein